jgi:hypothetical protein
LEEEEEEREGTGVRDQRAPVCIGLRQLASTAVTAPVLVSIT